MQRSDLSLELHSLPCKISFFLFLSSDLWKNSLIVGGVGVSLCWTNDFWLILKIVNFRFSSS